MPIKNIIFDWSGCLVNDLERCYEASMYCLEKLGIKRISLEEYREVFTLPYMDFYRKYTDAPQEELDKYFIEYLENSKEPELYPTTIEVLDYLRDKRIKIALLSSHPQKEIIKEMDKFGIREYFIDIEGSVLDKTKVINEIMQRNGFDKKETAYAGDMVHDINAGREAGVIMISIYWGYQSKEKLETKKPDYLISDLKEIKKIISS